MSSSTILYVADPKADVVLRSSDGIDFLVRRVALQVNSEVFDGMFASSSGEVGGKDEKTGFPVVKLEEKGQEVDLLLRWMIRDQKREDQGSMALRDAADLLRLSDKYGVDLVKEFAISRLSALAPSNPAGVLGPALAFRQLELVRVALSNMGGDFKWTTAYDTNGMDRGKRYPSGSTVQVSNISDPWLEQISSKTLMQVVKLEEKVLCDGGSSTWASKAKTFKFE